MIEETDAPIAAAKRLVVRQTVAQLRAFADRLAESDGATCGVLCHSSERSTRRNVRATIDGVSLEVEINADATGGWIEAAAAG